MNGNPILFTNKSSIALKNFNVFGSNNLKIPINLINDSQVKVDMLDVTGRIVDTIFDGNMKSGENILQWSSSNHASGMYIVRTTIDNKHNYEKTILLK